MKYRTVLTDEGRMQLKLLRYKVEDKENRQINWYKFEILVKQKAKAIQRKGIATNYSK